MHSILIMSKSYFQYQGQRLFLPLSCPFSLQHQFLASYLSGQLYGPFSLWCQFLAPSLSGESLLPPLSFWCQFFAPLSPVSFSCPLPLRGKSLAPSLSLVPVSFPISLHCQFHVTSLSGASHFLLQQVSLP